LRRGRGNELTFEREPHVAHIVQTPAWLLPQAELDGATNRRRDVRRQRLQVRLALEHSREGSSRILGAECALPREHLVEYAAERPDVGALIDGLAPRLFRAHVGGRPNHAAGLRQHRRCRGVRVRTGGSRVDRFGDAEIEHLGNRIVPELNVRGFQIAVHDAALVCGRQRIGNLRGDGQRLFDRKPAPRDPVSERLPLDQLHRQRGAATITLDAIYLSDVRVIERREYLGLPLKSRETAGVVRKGRRENLQGDIAFQMGIAGAIHLAHAARANQADNLVRPEAGPRSNGHRSVTDVSASG
jgi:hypothetical protein